LKTLKQKRSSTSSSKANNITNSGAEDTVIVIPFALANTKRVNGFITATLNDSISLYYQLAKDYKGYPQSNTNNNTGFTSTKFAALIMLLEKNTFGYEKFKVSDYQNLFKSNNPSDLQNAPFLVELSTSTQNVFATMSICITTQIPSHCTCNDPASCDMCLIDCAYQICFDFDVEVGGGDNGPIPGGGSTGTSGGSGIPYLPPPCANPPAGGPVPLVGNVNNVSQGPALPPCPPPGPGTGWNPAPPVVVNPCDVYISSLQNDSTFASKFRDLGNQLSLPYEVGYEVQNRQTNTYSNLIVGNATSYGGAVEFPNQVDIDGTIHSHFNGLGEMFSPGDVLSVARTFLNNQARDKANLFMGVATGSGNYLIKITDTAKFRIFANKIAGNADKENVFKDKYNEEFNNMNNSYFNEKGFLKMMQDYRLNGGLTLYRDFENCKKWKALTLQTSSSGPAVIEEENCY
jgi:hypothetical protein